MGIEFEPYVPEALLKLYETYMWTKTPTVNSGPELPAPRASVYEASLERGPKTQNPETQTTSPESHTKKKSPKTLWALQLPEPKQPSLLSLCLHIQHNEAPVPPGSSISLSEAPQIYKRTTLRPQNT